MSLYSDILADTPKAYWPMQETSGTTLADATGNGHTATLTAPYTLNAHTGPDCAGPTNRSVEFAYGGSYFGGGYADAANLLQGNVDASIELCVFFHSGSLANVPTLICQRDGPSGLGFQQGFVIEPLADGSLIARWAVSAGALSLAGAVKEGCWNHLFVEHKASTQLVKGWVNGCPGLSFTTSGSLANQPLRLAADPVGPDASHHHLDGYLAHVAVYDHLGPGDAVLQARARALCGRCTGLCEPAGGWHVGRIVWS